MVDRTRYPQWLRSAQALTYLDEIWQLRYASSTFSQLCSRGLGSDAHYRGRTQVFMPEALDRWARSRVRGPVAPLADEADLAVTSLSTAPLPPISASAGEWRATP